MGAKARSRRVRQDEYRTDSKKPSGREHRLSDRAVFVCFVLAVLIFYLIPIFDSTTSIQWDAVDVHYTAQKRLSESIHKAKLPFWTPATVWR
jgi:hypothetical protein